MALRVLVGETIEQVLRQLLEPLRDGYQEETAEEIRAQHKRRCSTARTTLARLATMIDICSRLRGPVPGNQGDNTVEGDDMTEPCALSQVPIHRVLWTCGKRLRGEDVPGASAGPRPLLPSILLADVLQHQMVMAPAPGQSRSLYLRPPQTPVLPGALGQLQRAQEGARRALLQTPITPDTRARFHALQDAARITLTREYLNTITEIRLNSAIRESVSRLNLVKLSDSNVPPTGPDLLPFLILSSSNGLVVVSLRGSCLLRLTLGIGAGVPRLWDIVQQPLEAGTPSALEQWWSQCSCSPNDGLNNPHRKALPSTVPLAFRRGAGCLGLQWLLFSRNVFVEHSEEGPIEALRPHMHDPLLRWLLGRSRPLLDILHATMLVACVTMLQHLENTVIQLIRLQEELKGEARSDAASPAGRLLAQYTVRRDNPVYSAKECIMGLAIIPRGRPAGEIGGARLTIHLDYKNATVMINRSGKQPADWLVELREQFADAEKRHLSDKLNAGASTSNESKKHEMPQNNRLGFGILLDIVKLIENSI